MDFIGPLLSSNGFDTIAVFTDRLSKGVFLVLCHSTIISKGCARPLYLVVLQFTRTLKNNSI